MKRLNIILLVFTCMLCACSSASSVRKVSDNTSQDVSDVIADLAAKQEEEYLAQKEADDNEKAEPSDSQNAETDVKLMEWTEPVDIDLTQMNATMIYSEVYQMMAEPQQYEGKTIRIYGMYTHFYEETKDRHYYACVVQDATACCASGLEFVLQDVYQWPDDYPENGDEIVLTGIFHVYEEENFMVMELKDALLEGHTERVPG